LPGIRSGKRKRSTLPDISHNSIYRIYLDFLETAEHKRRWTIFDNIPWEKLDARPALEANAKRIEIYCAEEMYVPDYASLGVDLLRSVFGMAWFQTRWSYEESQHSLVFGEYLMRSGLRTRAEFDQIHESVLAARWKLPFVTPRRMVCYGAIQEAATFLAYNLQRRIAQDAGDPVLEAIFFNVGRDEAAHSGFYRQIIELELAADRAATIADIAHVIGNFKMPGDGLIPDYNERIRTSGAGISRRKYVESVIFPLLTTLEVSRDELKTQLKMQSAQAS
jgi:acyl-[acyl-carrier-protein] desaturase